MKGDHMMNEEYMGYFEEHAINHLKWKVKKDIEIHHISSGHLEGVGTVHAIYWEDPGKAFVRTVCVNHLVINKMFSFEITDLQDFVDVLGESNLFEGVMHGFLTPEEAEEKRMTRKARKEELKARREELKGENENVE